VYFVGYEVVAKSSKKKGVPRLHVMHAAWELLFPRSALFLLISLWKNLCAVWSITLGNENIFISHYFNKIDANQQLFHRLIP